MWSFKMSAFYSAGLLSLLTTIAGTNQAAQAEAIESFTLNMDLNNGASYNYSGTAMAQDSGTFWNSFDVSSSPSTLTISNVQDSEGNTLSGVDVTIASKNGAGISRWSNDGLSTPNPLLLMRDYTFGNTYNVTVSGLPAGTYNFWYYGHGDQNDQAGTVTVSSENGGGSGSTANSELGRDLFNGGEGISYASFSGKPVGSSGTFSFQVANFLNGFQLQRATPPVISGLSDQTIIEGTSTVLAPTVSGVPYPALQWYDDDVALTDQTNATLALDAVQYAQNGVEYSLKANNPAGTASSKMVLSVIVTPTITELNNLAVTPGNQVVLAPTVSGVPTPSLQWLYNGAPVSGSTGDTFTLENAQESDSGLYSLIAQNAAGIVTNSMALTISAVNVAPEITGPTDQTVVEGNDAMFTASVSGLPAPTLQWQLNGTAIPGATNASLTVSNIDNAQNGDTYTLQALNSAGSASASAALFVLVPPSITLQPADSETRVGESATFSVNAAGVPAVTYQWSRNGVLIPGATDSSYTVSGVQGSDNGTVFSVKVANSVDSVVSREVTLTALSTMSGHLLPATESEEIAPDQPLRIEFSGGTAELGTGRLQVRDAADDSIFATIDTSDFVTFIYDGATVHNGAIRKVQGKNGYYEPIAIDSNAAWITLNSDERFEYNHSYYVTFDTGLFLDENGASYPGMSDASSWTFSIKASGPATPTRSSGPTEISVGLDGAGDFATLQGAVDWIPQDNTLHRTITIEPGTYRDYTLMEQDRDHVTILGAGTDRKAVYLYYPYPTLTSGSAGTLTMECSDVNVRNLTLDTKAYETFPGRMRSLYSVGDRLVFQNVLITGGQDTLYANAGSIYFKDCEIWGSVDFIYGGALTVFDQCNIVQARNSGGPITAPNTSLNAPYGEVFLNCAFPLALKANGYPYDVGTGTTTFQRPWGKDGMTAIINGRIGSHISTKGWGEGWNNETTARSLEYGTTMLGGGAAPTIAQRQAAGAYWVNTIDPDYVNNRSLSTTDPLVYPPNGPKNRIAVSINPADYTVDAMFGHSYYGLGNWRPALPPLISSQPEQQTANAGESVHFSVTATAIPVPTYQWKHNGLNIEGATGDTLTIDPVNSSDAGSYSVEISNSAGTVISSAATLNLDSAPQIGELTDQTVKNGSDVTLNPMVSGTIPMLFQWQQNGQNLNGATNRTLQLANVQLSQNGNVYSLLASNALGADTNQMTLTVVDAPNGFCTVNGTITGGEGGPVVTVSTAAELAAAASASGPRIIQLLGIINVDGTVDVESDKTIAGLGEDATLIGRLRISRVQNVIIRNIHFTDPGDDGIAIRDPGTSNIWVDHCTFVDCGDGACDISQQADYVTVSWCKFVYPTQIEHQFTMIGSGVGAESFTTHITLHHNWWSTGSHERMPASGDAIVHMYNNYFDCTYNYYCSNARDRTQILSENNYYSGVKNPLFVSSGIQDGFIQSSGNIYSGCSGTIHPGTDTVFEPPYTYTPDAAADVPSIIRSGAGAKGVDLVSIPAKIWNGGGSNNNLSNAGNWAGNQAAVQFDVLSFSGIKRLTPYNDFSNGKEFAALHFSNTAEAFKLSGNMLKPGFQVTDDSAATQTINLNLDLLYGLDHYTFDRIFDVTSPEGRLVINGSITGYTNTYYQQVHAFIKRGAGLLELNGNNTLPGPFRMEGGWVQFNSLSNLGNPQQLDFNGGGLRWSEGNSADISGKTQINTGGATFDTGNNAITFASPLSGPGGLTKCGPGRLTLNGSNRYAGPTQITEGTLSLGAAGSISFSPQIILTENAVLDVSERSDGTLTLNNGKSLLGSGSVRGSVIVANGAELSPGTMNVSAALTLQSGSRCLMTLNGTHGLLNGMSTITYGGNLVVENLGPTLSEGNSFKLFDAASYAGAFDAITLPELENGLAWVNTLAENGTLSVVSSIPPVNMNPTKITFSMEGNSMLFSWPADHIGWTLEANTNSLTEPAWFSISDSTLTNNLSIPVFPQAEQSFFRMRAAP